MNKIIKFVCLIESYEFVCESECKMCVYTCVSVRCVCVYVCECKSVCLSVCLYSQSVSKVCTLDNNA